MATLDIGINSAKVFWSEVVLPDYDQFRKSHTARDAVHAALTAWHLHDWVLREQPSACSTNKSDFQKKLIAACPELGWVRDYAETAKHRCLSRQGLAVNKVERDALVERDFGLFKISGTSAVTMFLDDGSARSFADVLSHVIDYWRTHWFPA
jgi:hypothetical protein